MPTFGALAYQQQPGQGLHRRSSQKPERDRQDFPPTPGKTPESPVMLSAERSWRGQPPAFDATFPHRAGRN
ncbi:hypothetical protein D9M73_283760 [compost metagenome]